MGERDLALGSRLSSYKSGDRRLAPPDLKDLASDGNSIGDLSLLFRKCVLCLLSLSRSISCRYVLGFTLVLSSSISSFAASDSSPLIVLVRFLLDVCRLSRIPLSLAGTTTGLPPAEYVGLDCVGFPLADPLFLKVLSCLGLVERLTTPPRPTFRVTFLLDVFKLLACGVAFVDFFDVVSFFFVVNRTWPFVVFVIVIAPPLVVFTSSFPSLRFLILVNFCLASDVLAKETSLSLASTTFDRLFEIIFKRASDLIALLPAGDLPGPLLNFLFNIPLLLDLALSPFFFLKA